MPYILKKTFDLILSLCCHFVAQVKGNCRRLLQDIRLYTALANPFSSFTYYENKHGYEVYRTVELYRADQVELPKGWNGIERIIRIRRWGLRQGKKFDHFSFYVTSKSYNSASNAAFIIQSHWSIENNLHWIKDVNMGEDDMSIRKPHVAATLAFLNNAAINILKKSGYKPTRDTFALFSNKVKELYKLFDKN